MSMIKKCLFLILCAIIICGCGIKLSKEKKDTSSTTTPQANFSAMPTAGGAPLTVQFTNNSTGTISSYAWDFNNDGTVDSSLQNPSFSYTASGTYTV
ncbi:MAG: PKD domain-containing protein, partial [Planctomycetota bacterium]